MAFSAGNKFHFEFDGDDLSSFLDNVDFPQTKEVYESTTSGADSKTYVPGLRDASFSISGRFDSTSSTGPNDILNAALAGGAEAFEYGPEGATNGFEGDAICTGYNVSSPVGGIIAFTADFQVTGDVTYGAL